MRKLAPLLCLSLIHICKNLLATASVTLSGCFAVCGIQIRDGKHGTFVSMPQRKDAKGEYHDICFPTTAEMRQAINAAVLGEYERTAQRDQNRGSVLSAMRDTQAKPGRVHELSLIHISSPYSQRL